MSKGFSLHQAPPFSHVNHIPGNTSVPVLSQCDRVLNEACTHTRTSTRTSARTRAHTTRPNPWHGSHGVNQEQIFLYLYRVDPEWMMMHSYIKVRCPSSIPVTPELRAGKKDKIRERAALEVLSGIAVRPANFEAKTTSNIATPLPNPFHKGLLILLHG